MLLPQARGEVQRREGEGAGRPGSLPRNLQPGAPARRDRPARPPRRWGRAAWKPFGFLCPHLQMRSSGLRQSPPSRLCLALNQGTGRTRPLQPPYLQGARARPRGSDSSRRGRAGCGSGGADSPGRAREAPAAAPAGPPGVRGAALGAAGGGGQGRAGQGEPGPGRGRRVPLPRGLRGLPPRPGERGKCQRLGLREQPWPAGRCLVRLGVCSQALAPADTPVLNVTLTPLTF